MGFYFGQAAGGLWQKINTTIAGSTTAEVDTIAMTGFKSVDYILTAYETSGTKIKTAYIKVLNVDNAIKSQVYAKIGNGLDIEINPDKFLTEMRLQIVNNETTEIKLIIAKLQF